MQLFQYTTGAKSIGRMLLDHARQFYLQFQLFFKQISILLMIRVLKNGKKKGCMSGTFPYLVFCHGFCFRGKHTINLTVQDGGPLPFAFDILTTAFQYGNRVYTKYPKDIPDYFKQSFPAGYSWDRCMTFEDGGICTVSSHIKLVR